MITRALAGALLVVAAASTASAQATPEGTVIANTATASYSDANTNSYTNVTATVSVTVAFKAGVDVLSPAAQSPIAGSTGNTLDIGITNTGNGTDQFSFTAAPPANVTVTGYTYSGTLYATKALLDAALASVNVTAGSSITVRVHYDVASAATGSAIINFTATSVRASATSDTSPTTLTYTSAPLLAIAATPTTSSHLRGGAVKQTTFAITNPGSASGTFALTFSASAGLSGVSLSTTSVTIAAGATANVTADFTVATSATLPGTETIQVTATGSGTTPASLTGSATHTITKLGPALTMTKEALNAAGSAAITSAQPGDVITYRITVSNGGNADATTVSVSDNISTLPVDYVAASLTGDAAGWTLNHAAGAITASLTSPLPAGTSRSFTFQVTVR